MKKFKNRKNVKNVNNMVKNNANMDGFEELVNAAKEFKGALDDEVANREYERKKLAEAFEKKASNDAKKGAEVVENPVLTIDDVINAETNSDLKIFTFGPSILSSEPRGRVRTYDDWYGDKSAESAMQAVKDAINPVTEEKRKKLEILHKPFWLGREDFLTYKVEKSKKNKPASEVESLKAELEKYKILVKGYRLELSKLQKADMRLAAHFEDVCAERDNLAACLKSCERDLKHKDKVIERIKKKNAKRMSEKCDVIAVLNKEIEFQYKRREKAEKFVNTLGQALDLLKKNVEDYEHSIGR